MARIEIEGLIVDPNNKYSERGVMRDGGNGVKHVFFGNVEATPEAVAKEKDRFQAAAERYGFTLIRAMTKKVGENRQS